MVEDPLDDLVQLGGSGNEDSSKLNIYKPVNATYDSSREFAVLCFSKSLNIRTRLALSTRRRLLPPKFLHAHFITSLKIHLQKPTQLPLRPPPDQPKPQHPYRLRLLPRWFICLSRSSILHNVDLNAELLDQIEAYAGFNATSGRSMVTRFE
ncbi:hypothetical protein V5O48_011066 [Marasmius crinis-equi]|uniref:Uncharacterized protein n=1 Tax=Marasmius crinis-equi TaxID=585013 RepID=A0ABR3F6L1_9AGAR